MEIEYKSKALDDRDFWKRTGNQQVMKKISSLVADTREHPFTGIGKPEPLKERLTGMWSRRINKDDRFVYTVSQDIISVISMKGHYENI
jgi:toxin YoeB